MRVARPVDISNITYDNLPINPSTLSLIDHIRSGGDIPAIKLSNIGNGTYKVKDGRHRLTAYKMLGMTKIMAVYSDKVQIK